MTVVDAKHIMQHLDKKKAEGVVNESQQQIVYADRIILNKMDLVKDRRRLRPSNAASLTLISSPRSSSATKSVIDVNWVLNICAFDPRRILEMDPDFLSREGAVEATQNQPSLLHSQAVEGVSPIAWPVCTTA